jgi:hypothetical protein
MPTLYIKKGSTTYSITLYEKKPTNPALDINYGGKVYYAGLSTDLNHANATPVRVSMGGNICCFRKDRKSLDFG